MASISLDLPIRPSTKPELSVNTLHVKSNCTAIKNIHQHMDDNLEKYYVLNST